MRIALNTLAILALTTCLAGCDGAPPASFLNSDLHMMDPGSLMPGPEHMSGVTVGQFFDAMPAPRDWEKGPDGSFVAHSRPSGSDTLVTLVPVSDGGKPFARVDSLRAEGHLFVGENAVLVASRLVKHIQMAHLRDFLR